MQLVCFDTETTGLDVQKEHIIQLSLVKVEVTGDGLPVTDWKIVDQRDWYILPEGEFEIPAEAEAVHHISKAFLLEHGVSLRSENKHSIFQWKRSENLPRTRHRDRRPVGCTTGKLGRSLWGWAVSLEASSRDTLVCGKTI